MLVTEKEARAKWCPLSLGPGARMLGADGEFAAAGPAVNRSLDGLPLALACCGSGCMAWHFVDAEPVYECSQVSDDRFADRYEEAYKLPDDQADAVLDALDAERLAFADSWQPEAPEPGMEMGKVSFSDSKVIATFRRIVRDRRGYCGAFGKPEG